MKLGWIGRFGHDRIECRIPDVEVCLDAHHCTDRRCRRCQAHRDTAVGTLKRIDHLGLHRSVDEIGRIKFVTALTNASIERALARIVRAIDTSGRRLRFRTHGANINIGRSRAMKSGGHSYCAPITRTQKYDLPGCMIPFTLACLD